MATFESLHQTTFESLHQDQVLGSLGMFDRLIFKGHLLRFFPEGAFKGFLWRQGILLKDFGSYVKKVSKEIKAHVTSLAQQAGRPYVYLQRTMTRYRGGQTKEDLAREIAERDGVKEGLVCILGTVEPCRSFGVRRNPKTQRWEAVFRLRKCLHLYAYWIDREFGWMHVRLQTWFPFELQIYINGREWLCRQLEARGIGYQRCDNCLLQIDDLKTAQQLCDEFPRRKLFRVLGHFARWMNPLLGKIQRMGFGTYYWVTDQSEYATDVMFRDRASLEALLPDLLRHITEEFSAEDVLRFLGRTLHWKFQGEVLTDRKRRREGVRIKHKMKRNSIKVYDKWSVLRVETTINNPREFKVLRVPDSPEGRKRRWMPMGKGVANLWRYAQVSRQANRRYLDALAQIDARGKFVHELEKLCQSRKVNGKRVAKFNPVATHEVRLFAAVMAGEHCLNGFRNRDLALRLYPSLLDQPKSVRRRLGARVSRWIAKLRGHGLVSKVRDSRLYRVTKRGRRTMGAVLYFRGVEFPLAYQQGR